MSVFGIGTDIIEITRVQDLAARQPRFLERVFTEAERRHIDQGRRMKWARAAGKFAAKEAIAKAFCCSFSWYEVEVLPQPNGQPTAFLHGRAAQAADGRRLHLSISHSRDYATAVAVVEVECQG